MFTLSTDLHPDYLPLADATLTALVAAYPRVEFSGIWLYKPKEGDRSLGHVEGSHIALNPWSWRGRVPRLGRRSGTAG
jgi:hypothetical protein